MSLSFWKVSQFNMIYSLYRDMETFMEIFMEISSHKSGGKKATKKAFWGHFQLSEGYTYCRTFIVNRFLRSFWGVNQLYTTDASQDTENHAVLSLWGLKIQKVVFLGNFRLPEQYKYRRPPLENHFLRSFWVVNQLSTTSGSRDMAFRQFWDFWPKKLVLPTFQPDH